MTLTILEGTIPSVCHHLCLVSNLCVRHPLSMRLSHEGSTVEQPLAVRPVRLTHLFLAPAAAKGSAADRRLGPAGRGI